MALSEENKEAAKASIAKLKNKGTLTEAELKQLQQHVDAVEKADGEHHDHDHGGPIGPVQK